MIPQWHGPAFIGAMLALTGAALCYWSLLGWGIISGATPQERKTNLITKIKTPGTGAA